MTQDRLSRMLADQRAFNSLIYNRRNQAGIKDRIKELAMGVIEETLEFLRTFDYKVHRRQKLRLRNTAHSHEELIDIFKYWLSLVDINDFPVEKLEEMYFAKSQVVRYRYQEEWLSEITDNDDIVIVDIDMVLGDYITAMCNWAIEHTPTIWTLEMASLFIPRLRLLRDEHRFIDAEAVGVTHMEWQKVKHHFRTNGGKRTLPVYDDAQNFLRWCRGRGWKIVLVTSRPVNQYPNIFTDTLLWLQENELPFDYLWWADQKTERIAEGALMFNRIKFAVDDSETFVRQFASKGVKTYWLLRNGTPPHIATPSNITIVKTLDELVEEEDGVVVVP